MPVQSTPSVTDIFDHNNTRIYPANRWPEDAAWIEQCFTWTDRDSYLAWVADWKQQLASRVAAVRSAKQARRDAGLDIEKQAIAQSEREFGRVQCANLLLIRRLGKQRSAREREARLAA